MPLPTTRLFLTNLINRLSHIPLDPAPPPPISGVIDQTPNALSRIPLPHRHLIITLHVLFPNLLLPALDLLDRGLVQKLTLTTTTNPNPDTTPPVKIKSEEPEPQPDDNGDGSHDNVRSAEGIYLVYSTTTPNPPRKRKAAAAAAAIKPEHLDHKSTISLQDRQGGQKYVVHLQAWNCTCAAFAFSIVQSLLDGPSPPPELPQGVPLEEVDGRDSQETDWEFGGMSTDGKGESGGVPICKHLLAALLAERWGDALGEYVSERMVGKGEMAGVVADV